MIKLIDIYEIVPGDYEYDHQGEWRKPYWAINALIKKYIERVLIGHGCSVKDKHLEVTSTFDTAGEFIFKGQDWTWMTRDIRGTNSLLFVPCTYYQFNYSHTDTWVKISVEEFEEELTTLIKETNETIQERKERDHRQI